MIDKPDLKATSEERVPIYVQHAYDLVDSINHAEPILNDAKLGYPALKRVCIATREVDRWYLRVWTKPIFKADAPLLLDLLKVAERVFADAEAFAALYEEVLNANGTVIDPKVHVPQMKNNVQRRIILMQKIADGDLSWEQQEAIEEFVQQEGDEAKSLAQKILREKKAKLHQTPGLTMA